MKIWHLMVFVGITGIALGLPALFMAALVHLEWMIGVVDTLIPDTWWSVRPAAATMIHALIGMALVMLEVALALLALAAIIGSFTLFTGNSSQLE